MLVNILRRNDTIILADPGTANKGLDHWGIRITDNLEGTSTQWEFDWVGNRRNPLNWIKVLRGEPMPGAVYVNRTVFERFDLVGQGLEYGIFLPN